MKILIEHFDTLMLKNIKFWKADLPSHFQNLLTLRTFWGWSYKHAGTIRNMHKAGKIEFESTHLWISRSEHHLILL